MITYFCQPQILEIHAAIFANPHVAVLAAGQGKPMDVGPTGSLKQ